MNLPELLDELKRCNVFPVLDGDQLKLTGETENLSNTVIASVKAQKKAIIDFLTGTYRQLNDAPILPAPRQSHYPCTNAQKRIWLLTQMEGAQRAYNIVTGLYVKANIDHALLEKAFLECIHTHESLRTVFRIVDGELCQTVVEEVSFSLQTADFSAFDNKVEKLRTELNNAAAISFDLSAGPLIRVILTRLSANEFALIIAIHHIISDGWSMGVLINQVMQQYESLRKGENSELPSLPVQYKDYTCWLQNQLAGEKGVKAAEYWSKQFPHDIPVLSLPYDYPRPAVFNFEGAASAFRIDACLHTRIRDFCKTNKTTLFNFLHAVVSLMLHKLSGQPYVVAGFPVSGRNRHELQDQVGLYVNTLPLATEMEPGASFMEFFKTIEKNTLAAMEFQDYPLNRIIDLYSIKRDTSRHPLFDVMMVLQNSAIRSNGTAAGKFDGFDVQALSSYLYKEDSYNESRPAKADLTFNFTYNPDLSLWLEIEYATSLFTRKTVLQFYNTFRLICNQVLDEASIQLAAISIVDEREKQALIHNYNQPVEEIQELSITELLKRSFLSYSDEIAFYAGANTVTYRQVQEYSDAVAANLTALTGNVRPLVGLLMDRSEWTIITILGIWKAGMAYVPIDKKYPAERIDYIIQDAQLEYLVIDTDTFNTALDKYEGKIIPLESLKKNTGAPAPIHDRDLRENIAYIIYTSGSTGKPKGVQVCHRNTIAFLKWAEKEFSQTAFDVLYAATSYCFDLSVFEFFVPLLLGKPVRILASAIDIPEAIATEQNVFLNTVPSVVRNLEQNKMDWSRVSALNIAGEPLTRNTIKHLEAGIIEIRNLYGPTEDTTYSTIYRIQNTDDPIIPIGKPVGYTHLYILDADKNLLPPGVPGEIYLSGQSIAKGYLGKPALTAERFCDNPFVPGLPMYRTGDRGKLLPDGNVVFLQRLDDQVKIRGYRIEPGEIQSVIEQHPQVKQAIIKVLHNREGEAELIAYWQAASAMEESALKTWLAQKIPAYMLPGHWMQLESFPMTSNGKIDKERLPAPAWNRNKELTEQAPAGYLQETLYSYWQQLLNKQNFGIHQNFFELGGHSLLATRLKFLINERLNKHITLPELFSHTTIASQAALLEQRDAVNREEIPAAPICTHYPISLAQEQLWVLTNFKNASVAYNMPAALRMKGRWDIGILQQAFRSVIDRYEVLRTVFTEMQGEPVQQIKKPEEIEFAIETVQPAHLLNEKEEMDLLKAAWAKPFDLNKGPLMRVFIVQNGESNILSFNMHHLISDGWSLQILCREVITAYQAVWAGETTTKTALPIQYKDFASWQKQTITNARAKRDKQYWLNEFTTLSPALQLPADFHRPEVKTYNGQTLIFQLEETKIVRFKELLQQNGAGLFIGLTALVNILMKKYAGQNDITLGTLVSGRNHFQLENQIGFFVNTLAIRTRIDPNAPVTALLAHQKQVIYNAFEHQELPFEQVLRTIDPPRDLSRSPLFDVLVVLQQEEEADPDGNLFVTPGFQLQRLPLFNNIAKYDLTFEFRAWPNALQLEIQYNSDLFKAETIDQMAGNFTRILDQVVETPQMAVEDITLMHSHKQAMLQYTGRKDDQVKIREHRIAAIAARDEIDEALIAIWEAILERNNIGIEDNFFDLGGHSLKATRVISKITEQYGIRIDLQFFFQAPTIENLSNYIRSARNMQNTLEVAAGEEDELII